MTVMAIHIQNLCKSIRTGFLGKQKSILKDVNMDVEPGEVMGFIGLNGAGKSTTIMNLIGATRPTSGTVQVFGKPPASRELKRKIGYLPELPRLPESATTQEILSLHASLLGLQHHDANREIDEIVNSLDLESIRKRKVSDFSKGMQQRVGLGIALLGKPELLILDEPMSGLDPYGRQMVRNLISDCRADGRTVFFSSHVLPDVATLCDRITILHQGSVIVSGKQYDIFPPKETNTHIKFTRPNSDLTPKFPEAIKGDIQLELLGNRFLADLKPNLDALQIANNLRDQGFGGFEIASATRSLEEHLLELLSDSNQKQAAENQRGA
jgi:ABC-2 type transport system ATP-binding protein